MLALAIVSWETDQATFQASKEVWSAIYNGLRTVPKPSQSLIDKVRLAARGEEKAIRVTFSSAEARIIWELAKK